MGATPIVTDAQAQMSARQWTQDPIVVAYTGTAARSALLPQGMYRLYATSECYVLQGDSTVVATNTKHPLAEKVAEDVWVQDAATGYISAIQDATGGNLFICPQKRA